MTVMLMTGTAELVQKDGETKPALREGKPPKTVSCTDAERKKVQQQIMSYVGSATSPAAAASAKPSQDTRKK